MKYEDYKRLQDIEKMIRSKVAELQINPQKQRVVTTQNEEADKYWLLNADVTTGEGIPIAVWVCENEIDARNDFEPKDWQEIVKWLFEKYTDGDAKRIYLEYM